MAEFNLNNIYQDVFGYQPPQPFTVEKAPVRKEFSDLGQPYYESDAYGREFFLPIKLNGLLLPFAVMSMNWTKRIIETAMPERNGEVNELISTASHTFNIKGLLIDEDGNFPEAGIKEIYDLFQLNAAISLRSALSDIVLKGSSEDRNDAQGHRVIIRDVKWPHTAGVEHVKAFEIDVKEDRIFELIIG